MESHDLNSCYKKLSGQIRKTFLLLHDKYIDKGKRSFQLNESLYSLLSLLNGFVAIITSQRFSDSNLVRTMAIAFVLGCIYVY